MGSLGKRVIHEVISGSHVQPQPWGGGAGETRWYFERIRFAQEQTRLRFAVSTIVQEDSAFTRFDEMHRVVVLLSGDVELTIDGEAVRLNAENRHHYFRGSTDTTCRVHARPVEVFNLIFTPDVEVLVPTFGPARQLTLCAPGDYRELHDIVYSFGGHTRVLNTGSVLEASDSFHVSRTAPVSAPLELQGDAEVLHVCAGIR